MHSASFQTQPNLDGPSSVGRGHQSGGGGGYDVPVPVAELLHVWRTNSFDTRGAHDELLSLLTTSVKSLLHAAASQDRRVSELERKAEPLTYVAETVARCNETAEQLGEARKRIDFMWASQGLSSLSIGGHGNVATAAAASEGVGRGGANDSTSSAAPQKHHHHPPSPSPPPPPQQQQQRHHQPWASSISLAQLNSRVEAPPASDRLDAASEALRRSVENQQRLQRSMSGGVHDDQWQRALDERLGAIEGVVDGVFGVAQQLQGQTARLAGELEQVQRYAVALEGRTTANAESLKRLAEQSDDFAKKSAREVDRIRMRADDTASLCQRQGEALRQAVVDSNQIAEQVGAVKAQVPNAVALRALVASAITDAASGQRRDSADGLANALVTRDDFEPLARRVDDVTRSVAAAYMLLDVKHRDALTVFERGMSAIPSAAKKASSSTSPPLTEQELREQSLQLIHGGLPFRTLISAVQRLGKAAPAPTGSGTASAAAAPPAPPLPRLGMRLRETGPPPGHASSGTAVVVDQVLPGSFADAAGIREGDTVLSANGALVATRADFESALRHFVSSSSQANATEPAPKFVVHVRAPPTKAGAAVGTERKVTLF